ncbi:hypothetical protein [Streptomyces griseosporeus]|uniref:hypothetical protein n=1 Tax=Streptomyces griseosporeus TaxID=1910 RepID=UPI00167DB720|nr:hypothetical protein [Streptomyces griseosporeus]GHF92278.1 hypothetical protein GCM10018783_73940 [Streptomyces griseosporeus]
MKCIAHLLGLTWECRDPESCTEDDSDGRSEPTLSDSVLGDSFVPDSETEEEGEVERQTYKDDSTLRDQQSTGRKRAARWYPLDDTKLCEWAGKKNCGGGKHPITGCVNNLQQARHHGPDKNTLNNEQGNVHRICHSCHNRWHTLNDPDYVWNDVYNPHSPVEAELDDFVKSEQFWEGRKVVKAKD